MANPTWNIIFIANNISTERYDIAVAPKISKEKKKQIKNEDKDAVTKGFENFFAEVEKTSYSSNLRFHVMEFITDDDKKDFPKFYENIKGDNKKNILKENSDLQHELPGFKINDFESYSSYFTSIISRNDDTGDNKYIIIFLAHCFGSGFFAISQGRDKITKKQKYSFFTSYDFKKAIDESFKDNKPEAFIALNCSFQNIENNIILGNSVKFIVGSQRPLFVDTIFYKDFFSAIISNNYQEDGLKLLEFFVDKTVSTYQSIASGKKEEFPLGLCISEPSESIEILKSLNHLSALLKIPGNTLDGEPNIHIDIASDLKREIVDPSESQLLGIYDCIQWFSNQSVAYKRAMRCKTNSSIGCREIVNTSDQIVEQVKRIKKYFVQNQNFSKEKFEPHGIGFYFPNSNFDITLTDVYKEIFSTLYQESPEFKIIKPRSDWYGETIPGYGEWNNIKPDLWQRISFIPKLTTRVIKNLRDKYIRNISSKRD